MLHNSPRYFQLSLLGILISPVCSFATQAAQWRDASYLTLSTALGPQLADPDMEFRTRPSQAGLVAATGRHLRKWQYYRGVRVLGGEIIEHRAGSPRIPAVTGRVAEQIVLSSVQPAYEPKQAEQQARALYPDAKQVSRMSSELVVTLDGEVERLAYLVTFFSHGTNGPIRPVVVLDANSGEVIEQHDGLTHDVLATGPGGNVKTGRYRYGEQFPGLQVTALGSDCRLQSANVTTIDLQHGTRGDEPYHFSCWESPGHAINGAYSPLNDAHAFGHETYRLYQQWLGVAPLKQPLLLRVHYLTNYENAFWDGEAMTFGDGARNFYPLVALDVVSHEVSHGFTEQNSALNYAGQSGGINEAFSDMAGEAAECLHQMDSQGACQVDWQVGSSIIKGQGALRYLDRPALDGVSIEHASKFRPGMDVHYSSGVFNRAFYLLATTPGWSIRQAFVVFARANQHYWTARSSFNEAACGVLHAAVDEKLDEKAVAAAFMAVGVQCGDSQTPPPLERKKEEFTATVGKGKWLYFGPFSSTGNSLTLTLSGTGDADLYVRKGGKPTASQFDCRPLAASSRESCRLPAGIQGYVGIKGYAKVSTIKLSVSYYQPAPASR
ncbi:MAG: M4 family metallopeptidase [Aeromonadaceae bacterium]